MGAIPWSDGAFVQGEGRVGNDFGRIRGEADAEAGAFRAGTFGAVKGEVARSETRGAVAGLWVFGFGGEGEIRLAAGLGEVGGSEGDGEAALTEAKSQFHRVGEAGAARFLDLETIDDQFQGFLRGGRGEIDPLPLAAGTEKALFL